MINNIFFMDLDPEQISHKMWAKSADAAEYYQNIQYAAEWAVFINSIFEVTEFYILSTEELGDFFVYVELEETPYDVSGFHASHEDIINDNEFYEGYDDIVRRTATLDEIISIAETDDVEFLLTLLVLKD